MEIKLAPEKKLLLNVGIISLVLIALSYFIYLPKIRHIMDLKSDLQEVEEKLEHTREAAHKYHPIRDQLEKILKPENRRLEKKIPLTKEIPQIQDKLRAASDSVNLEIISVMPQTARSNKIYQTLPIEMNLQGSYQSLARFFDKLNKLEWLVSVSKFQIQAADETKKAAMPSPEMTLNLNLNIITYSLLGKEN
ncbi:MAG: type 4a pilus biogenesis protein PilO [Planctomycetes bacterium]|nr:type 4a pilus biogenesis protein PilO [Planctomycetota bacterium]